MSVAYQKLVIHEKHKFKLVTGFLQVRENWKKLGNLTGQRKVRENETLVPPNITFSG